VRCTQVVAAVLGWPHEVGRLHWTARLTGALLSYARTRDAPHVLAELEREMDHSRPA
jgi:hypothetical protein